MDPKPAHVCLGSCHAAISDEEYAGGLVACGNDACENKGVPFIMGHKCPKCGMTYKEGETHTCVS